MACAPCLCAVSIGSHLITSTMTNCPHRERLSDVSCVVCLVSSSQRQCRLIYQQLSNSDVCLEENFYALMHGNNSDGVLEVCETVTLPGPIPSDKEIMTFLHPEWTSRDHDLSKTSGRRSALTNLEFVRPDHGVFFPPCSVSQCAHHKHDEVIERNTFSTRAACWFKNNCQLEMRTLLWNVHLIR